MIVIIGAGLTGLSAAYHLRQRGIQDILICEKQAEPGGLLRTARVDGFTFDHTGHFLHINDDYFASFLKKICNMADFDRIVRRSAVYTHNRINPYPFQMNLFGLPPTVIADCITGFVNRPRMRKAPQTFIEWVHTYFGAGIGKHFFFPFQQKILSYDLRRIEPSWTGRFVPKTNLRAMVEGAVAPRKESKVGYNTNLVYPKVGGIDYLISSLQRVIDVPIATEHELAAIDPVRKIVSFTNGRTVNYTHLISSMPLNHLLRRMVPGSRSTVSAQEKKLKCNSVLNINLGINKPTLNDVHWLYVPDKELPFYRVGFWHNICAALAPAGMSSLYAELSFMPGRITKQQLAVKREATIAALCKMLNIISRDIVLEHDLVLGHAYVIYDQWRKRNLPKLLSTLAGQGIHSVGRFGEWKYSSMQEAVLDGRQVADTLAPFYTDASSGGPLYEQSARATSKVLSR